MSAVRRTWITAFAGCLLAWGPALGQGQVDQESLRRLAEQLGRGGMDGNLRRAMEQFRTGNTIDPKFVDEIQKWSPDLIEQLLKNHGGEIDEKQLKQFMMQVGRPFGNSTSPPGGTSPPNPTPDQSRDPKIGPEPPRFPDGGPPRFPDGRPPKPGRFGDPPMKNGPGPNREFRRTPQAITDLPENRRYQEAVLLVEQSLGPIDRVPEVKQALIEAFMNSDPDVGDRSSVLKDLLGDADTANTPDLKATAGSQLLDWFKNTTTGIDLKLPSWGGSSSFSGGSMAGPRIGSSGLTVPSAEGVGNASFVVVALVIVAVIAALLWRFMPLDQKRKSAKAGTAGFVRDFDPRSVVDREGVVRGFENLTLLECGSAARVWNHVMIARALRAEHPESAEIADPLARLYEFARYGPISEPMTTSEIAEARAYLCTLAGVAHS